MEAGSYEGSQVELGQAIIHLPDEDQVPGAAEIVRRTLSMNHRNADYALTVPLDLLASKQKTQRILNLVLMVIAGISLLVGGIGIMNIMLAIVAERIPEIGVRRAIGASQRDILLQFLVETVVLSTVGGLMGCALGFVAVPLASVWTGWTGVMTPGAVLISLAVAWLVGVVFGIAPAIRAARLDPVECLRYQ
jgi:putative ABC transport system permease protein